MIPVNYKELGSWKRPSEPDERKLLPSDNSLSGRVTQDPSPVSGFSVLSTEFLDSLPLPTSNSPASLSPEPSVVSSSVSAFNDWLDRQIPLRDPVISSEPASASSSAAPSAASSSEDKRSRASVEEDSKVTKPKKKIKKTDQQFPGIDLFHRHFEIFYPVKSLVNYENENGKRVQGKIDAIRKDNFGVPSVSIKDRWVKFNQIDVPNLKVENRVMVFTEDYSRHVDAEVVQILLENTQNGLIKKYKMKSQDPNCNDFFFSEKTNENQMYRLIQFKNPRGKNSHAHEVKSTLDAIWDEFYGVDQDA